MENISTLYQHLRLRVGAPCRCSLPSIMKSTALAKREVERVRTRSSTMHGLLVESCAFTECPAFTGGVSFVEQHHCVRVRERPKVHVRGGCTCMLAWWVRRVASVLSKLIRAHVISQRLLVLVHVESQGGVACQVLCVSNKRKNLNPACMHALASCMQKRGCARPRRTTDPTADADPARRPGHVTTGAVNVHTKQSMLLPLGSLVAERGCGARLCTLVCVRQCDRTLAHDVT